MVRLSKSMAGKVREAGRRVAREYCVRAKIEPYPPCWKCQLTKAGKDCMGNPVGTRELKINQARAAVLELTPGKGGHV